MACCPLRSCSRTIVRKFSMHIVETAIPGVLHRINAHAFCKMPYIDHTTQFIYWAQKNVIVITPTDLDLIIPCTATNGENNKPIDANVAATEIVDIKIVDMLCTYKDK